MAVRAALAAVPLAVGALVCGMTLQQAHREQTTRHQQSAVLLTDSKATSMAWKGLPATAKSRAEVAWTGPHGTRHTAVTSLPGSQVHRKGTHTTIWVHDNSATLTTAPLTSSDVVLRALVSAGAAGLAVVAAATSAGAVRRSWTVRRESSRIQKEWELLAPVWTTRHR